MIKDTFNRIAREGLLLEHARQMGIDLSPAEERAMLRLDKTVYNKVRNILPKRFDEEALNKIKEVTIEAFREAADEFREEGDWEAFAAIHWVAGAQGFRL